MKLLYDELWERFPEIHAELRESKQDLPYLVMACLSDWIVRGPQTLTPEILSRIRSFKNWCVKQPRGASAGDDILTIFTVSFLEKLFESERTQKILPQLLPKADFLKSAKYLTTWVGKENYEKTAKYYH